MISKRRLALLSTLTAAPAFAAPFLAIGDNAELFLTARTEVRYEDNITYSSQNELEDEVFEVTPGVELLFGKNSLTQGSFEVQERISSYSDYNDLNSNLTNIFFDSSYDGAKLDLRADASFRELNQNSRDARLAATLVRRDVYDAGVDGEYTLTEKSKVGLAGKYSRTQYKTPLFSDQTIYTVPVNYYFATTEKVDLSAGLEYRKSEVAGPADSDVYYFNVGARGEFTPKLSGKFSVGYNLRESDLANEGDESGFGLRTGLSYAYSPKTNFTLDLSRDFETGSQATGIETSAITFGGTTNITSAFSLNASLGYSIYDYLAGNREDDFIVASVGATYAYSEHVSFDASYTLNDNNSDINVLDFTANVFRIAANFRY